MKTLGKKLLLTAKKSETTDIIKPTDIDYYEVAHVGSEVKEVKVGDKVFYQHGAKININGQEYITLDEDDITAILD